MPDAVFDHPRLAAIYDALDPDRGDLDAYVAIAAELGARRVVDLGCGTGVFALLLAERGLDVVGVDPAGASLDVARVKPGAEHVRWVHGDSAAIPPMQADLATMTGNAAQAVVDSTDWAQLLRDVRAALRPGGHFVFETRDPAFMAWTDWTSGPTTTHIDGVGAVVTWMEVTSVALPLVSFRGYCRFATDGAVLTSDSTVRFRERDEVSADLAAAGFEVDDIRDAPDRPGREFVLVARRAD